MKHIPSLDGVRGVAILSVMIHHLMVIQNAPNVYRFTEFGMYGVDLFFVLSGFLITGILLDSRDDAHAFRNFYARRSLRIFPLYYAVVAFCLLIVPFLATRLPRIGTKLEKLASVDGWLWYLTYTSNFFVAGNNTWRHAVLDITWSLSIEEQFYLIWAPLIIFIPVRYFPRLCIGLVVGAFLCRFLLAILGFSPLQLFVLTPCRMDALAAGALLAWYVRRGFFNPHNLARSAKVVALPLAFVLFLLLSAGYLSLERLTSMLVGTPLVIALCVCVLIIALYSERGGRFFSSGFLTFFGKYSYAIYLFHLPIRAVIRDTVFGDAQFRQLPLSPYLGQMIFYVIATLAVIPPALISWNLFEKRFLRLKRYFEASILISQKHRDIVSGRPDVDFNEPRVVSTRRIGKLY